MTEGCRLTLMAVLSIEPYHSYVRHRRRRQRRELQRIYG